MKRPQFAQPKYILPTIMFVAVLMVGVRVADMWDAVSSGKVFQPVTVARAAADAAEAAPAKDAKPATDAAAKPESQAEAPPQPAVERPADETSSAETALIKQLTDRRDELEKRNHALDTREALIKVAEQRVDQKIKEMETLRTQLQAMVNQASAAQQQQLDNLVKIYETMKPKEAAKIFETLDLPVLLGVVQKMKPQRTAAVMAEMNPEKAKEITVALTHQDQLPQIK